MRSFIYSVEMFSLESGQFTYVKPMPLLITNFSFCKIEYSIYLIGGKIEKGDATKDIIIYNTQSDSWTTGVSLP